MTSIEFYLARITARSLGADPKQPPGGRPSITADDIRAAISLATKPREFHAMMAKYCGDDLSEAALLDWLVRYSGARYLVDYPTGLISGERNQAIAESAMIWFLNPTQGAARGLAGNARHAGVDPKTWRKYYDQHWRRMTAELFDLEANGVGLIWRTLRG
jgi:hypothetical protein